MIEREDKLRGLYIILAFCIFQEIIEIQRVITQNTLMISKQMELILLLE